MPSGVPTARQPRTRNESPGMSNLPLLQPSCLPGTCPGHSSTGVAGRPSMVMAFARGAGFPRAPWVGEPGERVGAVTREVRARAPARPMKRWGRHELSRGGRGQGSRQGGAGRRQGGGGQGEPPRRWWVWRRCIACCSPADHSPERTMGPAPRLTRRRWVDLPDHDSGSSTADRAACVRAWNRQFDDSRPSARHRGGGRCAGLSTAGRIGREPERALSLRATAAEPALTPSR